MFINKGMNGKNNISGNNISKLRLQMGISQRELADKLQTVGLDIDKNAVQRIESGQRFVTDIELFYFCMVFNVKAEELFEDNFKKDV